jgi:hypothetical protein
MFDFDDDEDDGKDGSSVSSTQGCVKEAKEDIKLMNIVRVIVIMILLTIAFVTAETIFVVITIAEEGNFRDGYEKVADQIIDMFYEHLDTKLWVAQTLSTAISSDADAPWPFVTIPNFDARCEGPRHLSKASMILLDPLVTSDLRRSWENYAASTPTSNGGAYNMMSGSHEVSYFPTGRCLDQGIYRFQGGRASTLENSPFSTLSPCGKSLQL